MSGVNGDRRVKTHRPRFFEYLVVSCVVAAVTIALHLLQRFIAEADIIMAYLATVVVLAYYFNQKPTVLAALLSIAAFDFFFVSPFHTFAVDHEKYLLSFAVMGIVGLLFSSFSERLKQQLREMSAREKNLASLYQFARSLAAALSYESVFNITRLHFDKTFAAEVRFFKVNGTNPEELPGSTGVEDVSPTSLISCFGGAGKIAAVQDHQGDYICLPLGNEYERIAAAFKFSEPLSREESVLFETFFSLVDHAVTRIQLSEQASRAEIQAESEQLRNAVLSAVSHDLRTPLATIMGLASTLLDKDMKLDNEVTLELLETIYAESEQLSQKVTNLLQMSRSLAGKLNVKFELQNPEELIGSVLGKMKHRLANHTVVTRLDDTWLVPFDHSLMEIVLSNLLDNAVKFSPENTSIIIEGKRTGQFYELSVIDQGVGLNDPLDQDLFKQFYRLDNREIAGTGLGLAICKSIIRAHNGIIRARNNAHKGAAFIIQLPLADGQRELISND